MKNWKEILEKIWLANDTQKPHRVGVKRVAQRFNPEQPSMGGEFFETGVDDQGVLQHRAVEEVVVLDCGHQLHPKNGEFLTVCSCSKSFCYYCMTQFISHCWCGAVICPACRTHSLISGNDYCRRHRYSWIHGR